MLTTLPPPVTIYGWANLDVLKIVEIPTVQLSAMLSDARNHGEDEIASLIAGSLQFRQCRNYAWGTPQ